MIDCTKCEHCIRPYPEHDLYDCLKWRRLSLFEIKEIDVCPDYKFKIDRATALEVLKEFSRDMYPSLDLFGRKTLVINRDKFEAIRKKYLDDSKGDKPL